MHLLLNDPKLDKQVISLQHLTPALQNVISCMITKATFKAFFTPQQVDKLLSHQPDIELLLRDLVPLAQTYSHAPISNFHVGSVALASSGAIYLGANIEFERQSLSQTVHAEQAVITNVWLNGETQIEKLAVSATPCGHCRQFINELAQAQQLQILLPLQPSISFSSLLPLSFGPDDLGVSDRLMQSQRNNVNYYDNSNNDYPTNDPLLDSALNATKNSFSPYSKSPSGVAIETDNGIYSGQYAENCAYNPSLSPMQSALICLHLAKQEFSAIRRVILMESSNAQVSQKSASQQLLAQLTDVPLTYLTY